MKCCTQTPPHQAIQCRHCHQINVEFYASSLRVGNRVCIECISHMGTKRRQHDPVGYIRKKLRASMKRQNQTQSKIDSIDRQWVERVLCKWNYQSCISGTTHTQTDPKHLCIIPYDRTKPIDADKNALLVTSNEAIRIMNSRHKRAQQLIPTHVHNAFATHQ